MTLPLRALGLVLGAPLAVLALAVGLMQQARQAEGAAAALDARLAHALAHPAPTPETQAAAILVPGETAGLAASALQATVLALATGAGAEVTQVESAPSDAAGPLTRLHMTLRLHGTEDRIVATLVAIEGAVPLIFVDRLDLQGQGEEAGDLSATLVLSAWSGQVQP